MVWKIYDVTVRVIFDLVVVKCDHYFILLDISVKFCQILAYGQEHDFLRSWGSVQKSHQGIPSTIKIKSVSPWAQLLKEFLSYWVHKNGTKRQTDNLKPRLLSSWRHIKAHLQKNKKKHTTIFHSYTNTRGVIQHTKRRSCI